MNSIRAGVQRILSVALWLCAVVVAAAAPGLADAPQGHDTDAFRDAVALWLEDAEAEALPRLSAQAHEGNDAARLLLALIDKTAALQGPWLAALPRAERIDLMRAPGGLSGRSWIHDASEISIHAELWRTLWRADADATLPIAFAEAGEPRAARAAFVILHARGVGGLDAYHTHPGFPRSVTYLVARGPDDPVIDALHPGDPQRVLIGGTLSETALYGWLATAPEAALLRGFCDQRCSDTAPACTRAAYRALSDHTTLLMLGSPAEVLVPTADFAASPRGHGTLLRRAMMSTQARGRPRMLSELSEIDSCFAEELTSEIERYRSYRVRSAE